MEQEISLREIIEIIWKGKWTIILVTLFAMVASGVYSFFIIEPTYEARVTLSVNTNSVDGNGLSLPKYTEQVKSHAVMRATISDLELDAFGVTINSLRGKISTEIVKDTNLIRILVNDKDADNASRIANSITVNFVNYIKKQEIEHILAATEFEIDGIESQIIIEKNAIAKIQGDIDNTPEFIEVKKSLIQDPFLHSVVSEQLSISSIATGAIQYTDQLFNPIYQALQESIAMSQVELQRLESRRSELQKKIDEQKFMVKEYLLIASPAIPPEKPIAPNKSLNLAISGMLGGMISLFIVFIIHYWRTTAPAARKVDNNIQITS